ncbi:S-DNA-T family DNA segregation ATPase FtsK/SpoIIIE [Chitinophaga skermanii]|uniref:S-DNA-T family DNA segregation ATPase FtsK/SpoIIIE n=1 Tax=Chitinophaga skermanii TaxID=331697 RepID=A0A327QET9_9BACT|nr:DNA translocase FtsK [Chitinophaga skermanii]RAJ02294.1 S-DNA-T family DNA segregation ATPase FtsK/SpoIIIE [Chitinophaga skermanii]
MAGNKLKSKETKKKPEPVNPGVLKPDKEAEVKVKELVKDERTHKVVGTILLLLALYLFIAFTSFLFTWQEDQNLVWNNGFNILFKDDVVVENTLGRLGAVVSYWFFVNGFGLASYLFCYMLFIFGVNFIVGRRVFRVARNLKYIIFGLLYISTTLAFLGYKAEFPFGGALGNQLNRWICGFLGSVGMGLLLFVVGFVWCIWKFNMQFKWPESKPKPPKPAPVAPVEPVVANAKPVVAEASFIPSIPQEPEEEILPSKPNTLKDNGSIHLTLPEDEEEFEQEYQLHVKEDIVTPNVTYIPPVATPVTAEEDLEQEELEAAMQLVMEERDEPEEEDVPPVMEPTKRKDRNAVNDIAFEIKPIPTEDEVHEEEEFTAPQRVLSSDPYEPTLDLRDYKYPGIELLENHGSDKIVQDAAELEKNKNQIIDTLKNYDISIQKISATVGPTVTLYEIVPAAGVRISRIKNLEDDIALSLAALGIRIIAPIPGKGTIGIEVPNVKKTIVSLRNMLASDKFQNSTMDLPVAIGKKIDNENFIADLAKMPHLLMAGATGQGKSVGINTLLVSLLYKKHPSQLKFVLVDPKKVELSLYKLIEKHFLAKLPGEEDAIITDTKKVIHTLNALCIEMDLRYDLLKEAGTRNIREYNNKFTQRKLNPQKGHRFLPFIVLVVDEFADLIMTAGKEVEMPIARLAQLARAVGIHLIIATQRPSVNIITGTIKANFPARIAFKVSSKVDSRTILDTGGAEQLIGQGDMLISYNGEVVRLQCAFVDTPEVEQVAEFIGDQRGYTDAYMLPEYIDEKDNEGKELSLTDRDNLFEDAARIIVSTQQGSTSLLQRRMKLGYNRAGRLMDQLEAAGIVGPSMGSKAREVHVKTEADLEEILNDLL